MSTIIFDIEGDGFLNEITKIHCFSYRTLDNPKIITIYNYEDIISLLSKTKVLIGHSIQWFDVPALEKILGIKVECRLIDTLALSWYLNHSRVVHGIESYGEDFGKAKPKIDDWHNLPIEEYTNRCETDVWINAKLYFSLKTKLMNLYEDRNGADKLLKYLEFKMDCIREQGSSGWKLDKPRAEKNFSILSRLEEDKTKELIELMPPKVITTYKTRPAKPFKADGSYSVIGAQWFSLLKENGLTPDYDGKVEVVVGSEPANPGSPDQVKEWLFSLGWEPETFKYSKNSKGELNKIPQIRKEEDGAKVLCPSVLELASMEPGIKVLEDLTVITHRKNVFKNFLKFEEGGYLKAEVAGLTNTLRFKHKNPLVNLPGVDKPWGKEIRSCLVAPEGYVLCGSDMVSLESNTKRHYMYPYDPEYVEEMGHPDFDEHLDLAKQAGEVTQSAIDDYLNGLAPHIKSIRSKFKPANYACVYGVQADTLSRQTGLPKSEAQGLIDTYWDRNWAVLEVSNSVKVKKLKGELWLLNPVSGLYYSLRYKKDIFSTLNQGTGVWCFDTWISEWRKVRSQLTGQFHDEIISCLPEGKEEKYEAILREAMDRTNDYLKLNIKLDIDVQFGKTYADIH